MVLKYSPLNIGSWASFHGQLHTHIKKNPLPTLTPLFYVNSKAFLFLNSSELKIHIQPVVSSSQIQTSVRKSERKTGLKAYLYPLKIIRDRIEV